jgi:hypothetical protein
MEDDKPLSSLDADLVIWGAVEGANKVAEGEVDPEELLESVSMPALPDSDSWEGYGGWTAGLVRAVIEKIAKATDEDPKELWRPPPGAPGARRTARGWRPRR